MDSCGCVIRSRSRSIIVGHGSIVAIDKTLFTARRWKHNHKEIDSAQPRWSADLLSSRTLYVGTKKVTSARDAKGLPLAEKLNRSIGRGQPATNRPSPGGSETAERDWKELGQEIESIRTSYLISADALTPDDVHEKMMLMGRSVREKIQIWLIHKSIPVWPSTEVRYR